MNSKRLVLTILLLAAGVAPMLAQQSAQATMKVQVTVVEGNAITMKQQAKVALNKPEDSSELAELSTVSINSKPGSVYMLKRPERLNLTDDRGTNLEIPVIYHDQLSEQGITSEMNFAPLTDTSLSKSTYKGTITTSIAYL